MFFIALYSKLEMHGSQTNWRETMNAILSVMDDGDIRSLGQILQVMNTDENIISRNELANGIIEWTFRWKEELGNSYRQPILETFEAGEIWRRHRDLNNKLAFSGFYDFAFQVMTIEQPRYVM